MDVEDGEVFAFFFSSCDHDADDDDVCVSLMLVPEGMVNTTRIHIHTSHTHIFWPARCHRLLQPEAERH